MQGIASGMAYAQNKLSLVMTHVFLFLKERLYYTKQRGGSIYILTNEHNTTLYIGVTSDLINRIWEHKNKQDRNSFTYKYNLFRLVYYEHFFNIEEAIAREKQLKAGSRKKKELLINKFNPEWKDLYDDLVKQEETG